MWLLEYVEEQSHWRVSFNGVLQGYGKSWNDALSFLPFGLSNRYYVSIHGS